MSELYQKRSISGFFRKLWCLKTIWIFLVRGKSKLDRSVLF
jgi:hypothetical protein